jgi:hypothetical protein
LYHIFSGISLAGGGSAGRGIVASMVSKVTDFVRPKSWKMTTQKVTSLMQSSNRRDEGRCESSIAASPSSGSQRETEQKELVGPRAKNGIYITNSLRIIPR